MYSACRCSCVTALPDGRVVGYDPLVDDPSAFPNYVSVPEEGGAHVVGLDEKTLLMAASAPRTAEKVSHVLVLPYNEQYL